MRAILLASATATSIRGLRASILASQGSFVSPRRTAELAFHCFRNDPAYPLRRLNQMPVGEVGVARRCAVATVPEQSADQGQVLAGHDGLTGGGVPKVVQALPAELGVRTDRAPADNKAVRIPAFSGPCCINHRTSAEYPYP